MKRILIPFILIPLAAGAAPAIRDAATHDQLVKKYAAAQQNDPMARLVPTQGPDPAATVQVKDLVSQSDIISFNGLATMVPKGAILHMPQSVADRVNHYQNGSKLLFWPSFYEKNHGWITTKEVTRRQAEGKDPLDPEFTQRIGKTGNLVIATFAGGPISMLPPQPKEEVALNPNPSAP